MKKKLNIKSKLLSQIIANINKTTFLLKCIFFVIIYISPFIFKKYKRRKSNIFQKKNNVIKLYINLDINFFSLNYKIQDIICGTIKKAKISDKYCIKDYIDKGFVKVLNWRGKIKAIYKIMNDCYIKNNNNYDWLIFYEVDEFIHLYNNQKIKTFLEQKIFNKCQVIYLNFVQHTENNLLYYENKPLAIRFPEVEPNARKNTGKQSIKSIVRGHIKKFKINHIHYLNKHLKYCNGFGNKEKFVNYRQTRPDYKYNYIDHYYSKSTEEFINKVNRGDAYSLSLKYKMSKVKKYFLQSKLTLEKIKMIENSTGLNLSNYKKLH